MTYLKTTEDVLQAAFMESKRKWNFSAFSSIADEFDGLAEEGLRGDKGFYGSLALALFLALDEAEREEASSMMRQAMRRAKASGGSVLLHFREMCGEKDRAVNPASAPKSSSLTSGARQALNEGLRKGLERKETAQPGAGRSGSHKDVAKSKE